MRAETPSAGSSRRGHCPRMNRSAASRAACRLLDQTMLVASGCHRMSRRCNAYPAAKEIATGTASRKRSIPTTIATPCGQFMVSLLPGASSARYGHRCGLRRITQRVVVEMCLCLPCVLYPKPVSQYLTCRLRRQLSRINNNPSRYHLPSTLYSWEMTGVVTGL
jgi:hypothetical protein